MTGTTAPPYTYNAAQWLRDLEDRWKHFEKILSMVKKTPLLFILKHCSSKVLGMTNTKLIKTVIISKIILCHARGLKLTIIRDEIIIRVRVYAVLLVYRAISISPSPVLTFTGILLANVILLLMREQGLEKLEPCT